jgi:hypothetical protein
MMTLKLSFRRGVRRELIGTFNLEREAKVRTPLLRGEDYVFGVIICPGTAFGVRSGG